MNIKLTRTPDAILFLAASDNKVLIKIWDNTLFITQVELKPLFFKYAIMFWKWNVKTIILLYTQIKTVIASSGAQQVSLDNAFHGPNPERILIALVKNTAFVSASTHPHHFQHYGTTNLVL